MNLISDEVIKKSNIGFGTSGARGLVTDFTDDVCQAFMCAFIAIMKEQYTFDQVAIAIDNRPSSYRIAMNCASIAEQFGIKTIYYGVLPTPALAHTALGKNIPSVMITGSHIPFDRNGLKFYRPDGEITKEDEFKMLSCTCVFEKAESLPDMQASEEAAENYCQRYISLFNTSILSGKRIGIYEHSSAGRELYGKIFSSLGAEVISLGRSNEFVPIDTEAVSEDDRVKARIWSEKYKFDAIFSTDGDGDRPLVADEKGCWLRGDILGLLCADVLNIEAVAVPVSCNSSIELSHKFKKVQRTRIGSPYVIEAFKPLKNVFESVAGFEANGGFILGSDTFFNQNRISALPTRDAVLPALMLFYAACTTPISQILQSLPARFTFSDRIKDFLASKSSQIIIDAVAKPNEFLKRIGIDNREVKIIDQTDGARFSLDNGDIIHLRPSGNAPELRFYAEAGSESQAQIYVQNGLSLLATM
ncbi:phosphomannomutase [Enterobacteriaceae bacterium YMB-R22]|nr:phosphomannomutase [Tenebrionicola larvae]